MPWVEFEPTIPVFERAKTVHALDREATVIGMLLRCSTYCDALPESRNIGGCISDCFLDKGVPNTGNRRIAAVPIQRKRQHTSATELSDQVLSIQSAKRLLKGQDSKDSRREIRER
jgi:hypothetical protein